MVGWTVAGTEVDCRHGALALGRLDEFVFTAGIGENSLSIRAHIAEKLGWLGAVLDPAGNAARQP